MQLSAQSQVRIAAAGISSLNLKGFIKIIEALIISPIIAFVIGYIVYSIFKVVFKNFNLTKRIRTSVYSRFSLQHYKPTHTVRMMHKSNGNHYDGSYTNNYHTSSDIPFWVQLSCAIAMGLGTSVGGWKIIKTVGGQIMKIRPVNGVAADLSSSLVIFGATFIHLPVSTTHVISSSILGVGASHRVKGVKWGTAKRMLITWVITLPISASLAALFYYLLHFVF